MVASVPVMVLGVYQAHRSAALSREYADAQLRLCAESVAEQVASVAEGHVKALETLAGELDSTPDWRARLEPALHAVRGRYGGFSVVYAAGVDGVAIAGDPSVGASGGAVAGTSYADRPYFQDLLRTGKTVISEVEVGRRSGQRNIHIAVPIRSEGLVVGVLQGSLDLEAIAHVARAVSLHSPNVEIGIKDVRGNVITARSTDLPATVAAPSALEIRSENDPGGHALRTAVAPVARPLGWTVFASRPQSEIDADASELRLRTASTAGGTLLLCLMLGFFFSAWWGQPIRTLARAAEGFARGEDWKPLAARRGDPQEAITLMDAFNDMIRRLREQTDTLEETVRSRTAALEQSLQTLRTTQAQLGLADRMSSVGTLAAGVAHEINNPMAFVLSNVTFVGNALKELQRAPPAPQALAATLDEPIAALDDAHAGAIRVRDIVRDLRVFARAEDQKVGPVDLGGILATCANMAANEIRFRARLEKVLTHQGLVLGSEGKLSQVFLNLIVNAAQAIPEGASDKNLIRIATRDTPAGVEVEIQDSGSGIAPQNLPRIFDPFFTTKPVGQGTGLGLAISHSIITSLGGSIHVESTPGQGTTFRVLLPYARPETAPDSPLAVAPPVARPGRVLVIDDEPSILTAVRRWLPPPLEVVTVERAEDGLRRIASGEKFDVVLCDLMMPHMSGAEFYAALRDLPPPGFPLDHVLFLTGGAFTPATQEFLSKVVNRVIEKPFSPDELRAAISACL